MKIWISSYQSIEVHPTFLYESLWNFVGLMLILFIISKGRRFDGENTWFYFLWYGLGRAWIEGLRTDSLYLFDWTFMGSPIRVTQALSMVMVVVAAVMLFYNIKIKKRSAEDLLVNVVARAAEEAALEAEVAGAMEAGENDPVGVIAETEVTSTQADQPSSAKEEVISGEAAVPAEEISEAPESEAEEIPADSADEREKEGTHGGDHH